jgi:hypothetical protein
MLRALLAGGSRTGAALGALALVLPVAGQPVAAEGADLYRCVTIVTGQGGETRQSGFGTCLREVLVRLAGDPRLAADPRLDGLAARAEGLVSQFGYRDRMEGIPVHDEQGTRDRPHDLTVVFDKGRTDAALRGLGREPWAGPRPALLMRVSVENGATRFALSAAGRQGRDMREAIAEVSGRLGMRVGLPDEAMPADALPLEGSLTWSPAALGWIAEWRLEADGRITEWSVQGVSFDDAFRSGIGGAARILSGNGAPQ